MASSHFIISEAGHRPALPFLEPVHPGKILAHLLALVKMYAFPNWDITLKGQGEGTLPFFVDDRALVWYAICWRSLMGNTPFAKQFQYKGRLG
jgi:hypothetical protein